MRLLRLILMLTLITVLLASTSPAQAKAGGDVVSFSGSYSGPRMTRRPCQPNQGIQVLYGVQPFYVEVPGEYLIRTTWADDGYDDDTFLVLYGGGFDPSSPSDNCIASNNDGGGGLLSRVNEPLTPGVQYYAVVQAFNKRATSGSYRGEIIGPAAAKLGLLPGAAGPAERPPDDRLNWRGGDMYVTLYLRNDAAGAPVLHLYCVNEHSQGYLGAVWGVDELAVPASLPTSNLLIASVDSCKVPVNLYLLTTGEWALHIGPNATGDVQALIWRGLPPTGMYEVRYNTTR